MIGLFAVTAAGRRAAAELSRRLGAEAVLADGPVAPAARRMWPELHGAVFFLGSGETVRLIAPLLRDGQDPGVVCVDESRRFAIALAGDAGGANALARQVAELFDAQPVVTTDADSAASAVLDEVVDELDAAVDGDLAACSAALLDGRPVRLLNPRGFPLPALPANATADAQDPRWTIRIDDRLPEEPEERTLRLVPRTLVVGVGSVRDVSRTDVTEAVARLEREHGLDPRAIRAFATADSKSDERGILEAAQDTGFWHSSGGGEQLPLRHYPAAELDEVPVPHPGETARAELGTASVAEAAALRAAGEQGGRPELVVGKLKGRDVTVAAARTRPRGRLAVVGLGPGSADLRTPRAEGELRRASVVVCADEHLDQVRHLLRPGAEVRGTEGDDQQRAAEAVSLAESGRAVALIGPDDADLRAMASPALERAEIEVVGVAGVSSALEASALLGAPLGHDHAVIDLSDPRTPQEVVERRLRAAAEGDLVVCFCAPRGRSGQLARALEILAEHRPAGTPVGAVRRAGRDDQRVWHASIGDFDPAGVDELTAVVAGSSQSTVVGGRMVTPPGYRWTAPDAG